MSGCIQHPIDPERCCPQCAATAHAALCLTLNLERQTGMPRWNLTSPPVAVEEPEQPRALRRVS